MNHNSVKKIAHINNSAMQTFRLSHALSMPGWLLLLCLLFLLAACAQTPPKPPPAPKSVPAVAQTQPLSKVELAKLLNAAHQATLNEHLTFPKEGSAYAYYQQILAKDPDQEDALRGLEHIVERYIEIALDALGQRQFATARSMLSRARIILPDHPSIEPTDAQIRLLQKAKFKKITLASGILANQEQLQSTLSELNPPKGANCRYKIWARSDAQGRTIYQALVQATGAGENKRLRAQIGIRSPSAIEQTCFENT